MPSVLKGLIVELRLIELAASSQNGQRVCPVISHWIQSEPDLHRNDLGNTFWKYVSVSGLNIAHCPDKYSSNGWWWHETHGNEWKWIIKQARNYRTDETAEHLTLSMNMGSYDRCLLCDCFVLVAHQFFLMCSEYLEFCTRRMSHKMFFSDIERKTMG